MAAPSKDDLRRIEARAIGAALNSREDAALFVASLPPERMLGQDNRKIARAIHALFREGDPVTVITVGQQAQGVSASYLTECLATVPATGQVPYFARLIAEAHTARSLESRLRQAVVEASRAVDGSGDVFDLLDGIQHDLSALAFEAEGGARADTHISGAVARSKRRVEGWKAGEVSDFAPSGFYSIDRLTGGLPVGELTTLAAMTGAGKTSLLTQSARAVAFTEMAAVRAGKREAPRPIVLFSAEMSDEQITERMAAGHARINLRRLRAGKGTDGEFRAMDEALDALAGLPIYVDPEPSPTFAHVAARLTQVETMGPGGIAYVGVDYDEKINTEGATEELRVSAISKGLKDLAKRFRAPVLALSQYSRKATHDQHPSNDWLRYSGKKEHESAQIIHWHYPKYWVDKGKDPGGTVEYDPLDPERGRLVVSKNRFGPVGHVPLYFEPETTHFSDPNEPRDEPASAPVPSLPNW